RQHTRCLPTRRSSDLALRKDKPQAVKKGFLEGMFAKMMPRGADKLGLSTMNMAGMGPKMIKHVIGKHNAMTLPQLIDMAKEQEIDRKSTRLNSSHGKI